MTAMFRHLLTYLHDRKLARENAALTTLKARYHTFRIFLENNGRALELLVTIDSLLHRGGAEDIRSACEELLSITGELVDGLNLLADDGYTDLYAFHGRLSSQILQHLGDLAGRPEPPQAYCLALDDLEPGLIQKIGAKAANLAHLRRMSLPVPDGFVCTTRACRQFLHSGELSEKIRKILGDLENGRLDGARASSRIKEMVLATPLPPDIVRALQDAYAGLERRTMPAGRLPLRWPSPCAAAVLPRTVRNTPLPASSRRCSTSTGRRPCSPPTARSSPASSTPGPSPIASRPASLPSTSISPSSARSWSMPNAPGSCSPATLPIPSGSGWRSAPSPGWGSPPSTVRSPPTCTIRRVCRLGTAGRPRLTGIPV
jgi:hypothetical protein